MTNQSLKVGDAVECNTGEWSKGTIVALFYRDEGMPPGMTAPYQVQLDEGQRILLPLDNDQFIIGEDAAATQREECCEEEALALPGVCCDRKRETKFMR